MSFSLKLIYKGILYMRKIIFLLLLINPLLSFSIDLVPAIETPGAEGTLNDNKLYAGINWTFGVKASFNAILGLKLLIQALVEMLQAEI
jgi:hypothetical protein